MFKFIVSCLVACVVFFTGFSLINSATGQDNQNSTVFLPSQNNGSTGSTLRLDNLVVVDIDTIELTFSSPIDIEALRVRVMDQASNESLKLINMTGSINPAMVKIDTVPMVSGGSYVLTIISAVSASDGATIKSGIESIQEFTVPTNIKSVTLNAPTNPSAVLLKPKNTATGSVVSTGSVSQEQTGSGSAVVPSVEASALPATGPSSVILVILALTLATAFLFLRRSRT